MKLRNIYLDYHIIPENKTVVAKLESRVYNSKGHFMQIINTVGVARAKNEPFNQNKGKKLARARAEKNAYIEYRDFLKRKIHKLDDELSEFSSALSRVNSHIDNQRNYIKTF